MSKLLEVYIVMEVNNNEPQGTILGVFANYDKALEFLLNYLEYNEVSDIEEAAEELISEGYYELSTDQYISFVNTSVE